MKKWRCTVARPPRDKLAGYSYSEFKTMLKRMGHKVPRDLNQQAFITEYRNRKYRWRYWGEEYPKSDVFVVDISCPIYDFDRWANSVDKTVPFEEFFER